MFRVFDYGRGNYSYINPSREWQQTGTGFGKIILANNSFMKALAAENIVSFPSAPRLPAVRYFEYFTSPTAEKKEGVWIVRNGAYKFALPITVGTKPGVSDYLPVPYGLAGFATPVEEVYPALVPFLTLADGKTYAASDGADEIIVGAKADSLAITNRKWARIGSKSGERFENGLTSIVLWRIERDRLIRTEVIDSDSETVVKNWRVAIPSSATSARAVSFKNGVQRFLLTGRDGTTAISIRAPEGIVFQIEKVGDSRLGKGVLGGVPIHLVAEASDVRISRGWNFTWVVTFEIVK
jgi:hypothetical protein